MPRVLVPVTALSSAGVAKPAQTTGDPANGHLVALSEQMFVEIENTHATTPHTATFITTGTVIGLGIDDVEVLIPALTTEIVGPFPSRVVGMLASAGSAALDVSSADIKLRAFAFDEE